jgi:ABC-type multidrug transport system fused ATPase/permease subunit
MKAARVANAQEFIEQMPEGYQTNIGEGGSRLSGGQRQRLSIARAVFGNPDILILDEATSALDTEAERQVQQALNNVMRGRTTLVIAHRLSTTVDADEILVVEHGQIVERGTHQELLRQQGRYSQLVEMQSLHDGSNAATEQE